MQSSLASTSRALLQVAPRLRLFSSTSNACLPDTPTADIRASLPAQYASPTTTTTPPTTSTSTLSNRRTQPGGIAAPARSTSYFNTFAPAHPYRLSVFASRNNTILTLTTNLTPPSNNSYNSNPSEKVVFQGAQIPVAWVSSGSAGYKGASRGTFDAGVEVALRMFAKISELVTPIVGAGGVRKKSEFPKPGEMEIVWKGFGQGRDAVFRTLMGGEGDKVRPLVSRVTDATPIKIGGTRSRKRRVI